MTPTYLQPGDVRATIAEPRNPLHEMFAVAAGSPFVHAALWLGQDEASAGPTGVVRRLRGDTHTLILRHPDPDVAAAAVRAALSCIGQPYDFEQLAIDGLALLGVLVPDSTAPGFVCSAWVAHWFGGGIVPGVPVRETTPADLVERSVLKVIGYWRE